MNGLATSSDGNNIIYYTNTPEKREKCSKQENNGVLNTKSVREFVCFDGKSSKSKLDIDGLGLLNRDAISDEPSTFDKDQDTSIHYRLGTNGNHFQTEEKGESREEKEENCGRSKDEEENEERREDDSELVSSTNKLSIKDSFDNDNFNYVNIDIINFISYERGSSPKLAVPHKESSEGKVPSEQVNNIYYINICFIMNIVVVPFLAFICIYCILYSLNFPLSTYII